jgi:tetratricopeptide (TPR) repeat protein
MARTRNTRALGRESILDELFGTTGLEGDLVPAEPDAGFPLRPFASQVPQDDLLVTEPRTEETPVERLYRRALDAASRGRVAEAINRYRELLAHDPSHVTARNNLSHLLETTGDPEAALDQLSQAVRAAPDDVNLLVSRGAVYGRLKRYAEAETDLRRALRHDSQHVQAYLTLGLVLWRRGLPADAAHTLRRAIAIEPANATAWYYLGEALNQGGDLAGAREALEQAGAHAPQFARTWRLLGRVLDRLNRTDDAREMYRRAREATEQ